MPLVPALKYSCKRRVSARVMASSLDVAARAAPSSPSTPSDYKFELTAAFQKALDDQEAAGSSPLRPSTRQHHTTIDDQYNRIYVTTPSTTPSPTGGGRRPTSVHHHSIKRNLPTHPPVRESWVRGVGTRFSLRTRYGVRGSIVCDCVNRCRLVCRPNILMVS